MKDKTNLPPLGFIRADWIIQLVMLGIILFSTLFGFVGGGLIILAMLMLMPFGMWQVISGVVGAVYGSRWRMKYLGGVLVYFVFGFIGMIIADEFRLPEALAIVGGAILFIVPLALGILYMVRTYQDKKVLEGKRRIPTF